MVTQCNDFSSYMNVKWELKPQKLLLNNVSSLTTINFIDVVSFKLKFSLMHPAVLHYCRGIATGSITFQMLKYLGTRRVSYGHISPVTSSFSENLILR